MVAQLRVSVAINELLSVRQVEEVVVKGEVRKSKKHLKKIKMAKTKKYEGS